MLEIERRSTDQPPRLRHGVGPWRPTVARTCIDCGLCVQVCPTDVFYFAPGRRYLAAPRAEACLGSVACGICVPACPARAIAIEPNPSWACLGDAHWTGAMIVSTWEAGSHGAGVRDDPVAVGESDAGFDRLGLVVPEGAPTLIPDDVSLRTSLHHRGRAFWIELPMVGGAIERASEAVALARGAAAHTLGTLTTVAPEAMTPALTPYLGAFVLQVDGRLTGVTEAVLARASAIALDYTGPPFCNVYGLEDVSAQFQWLSLVNPEALLMVKINATADAGHVAAGVAHAGAHAIYVSSRADAGLSLVHAVPLVHRHLHGEGLRDGVAVIAGGGIRTPHDVLKAIALGADACAIDVAELVALGCTPTPHAGGGMSCPPEVDVTWAARRLVNLGLAWAAEWRRTLALLSLSSVHALRGRTDLLAWVGP